MNIKNLFNVSIEFITGSVVVSIIGILSFISAVIALIVSWRAYKLQKKSDKDLKRVEENIDVLNTEGEKIQKNVEKIKNISSRMEENVNKSHFQIERTTALNKYPEIFKEINNAYQPFISCLFDEREIKYSIGIQIKTEASFDLKYNIQPLKNDANIPIKKIFSWFDFYFIKILSPFRFEPSYTKKIKEYEKSPIEEGEKYACRFDEAKMSWVLGKQSHYGFEKNRFFKFYLFGSTFTNNTIKDKHKK